MKVTVINDEITQQISAGFDYEFSGTSEFIPPEFTPPAVFKMGLIVGPSGSGKSTLLHKFGTPTPPMWLQELSIASHFGDYKTAVDKLSAVGLNSVPVWVKPYHVLSTGEKFRADLAMSLQSGAVIDEFTSVVDRSVAKSCAAAIHRYVHSHSLANIVFASCHYDITEWLQPCWVFDTSTGVLTIRGSERRPAVELEIVPCSTEAWSLFRNHHYLSADINKSARCWIVVWDGVPVGFTSVLAFPNRNFKDAWRGHRTVILPEFQGLGIGVRVSDTIGTIITSIGGRYFSKTSHLRMGEYRERSTMWKATSKNKKSRQDYKTSVGTKEDNHKMRHVDRVCYSHEFIGNPRT